MKRNLIFAIVTPLILACILVALIILENNNSKKASGTGADDPAIVDAAKPTDVPTLIPTETSTPIPTAIPDADPEPTAAPTPLPTAVPTQTPAPTPKVTPTMMPASTPSPMPTPGEQTDAGITGTPLNPENDATDPSQGDTGDSSQPGQENTDGSTPTDPQDQEGSAPVTYNALYIQIGEDYTLLADSITKSFLFKNNKDNSIRQTAYKYAPVYEEAPDNFYGPVFGYKNKTFIFMAGNQLVASDGVTETILKTFEDADNSGYAFINPLVQSDNRFLAGVEGTLVVVDSRTLAVEAYHQQYSPDFFIFTDDYLCFSSEGKIQAGPYYNYLYTARDGNIKMHGMIGKIDEYVLDKDMVTIKSKDDLFQINLKDDVLTTSKQPGSEYLLYFPVYSPGMIQNLSDIRYINYNMEEKPVQSIQLPSSWEARCYYIAYDIPYFYDIYNMEKPHLLPNPSGGFIVINPTTFPLEDGKYLTRSTLKEKLFAGKTALGEGEIFLLERAEERFNQSLEKNESISYEIIYAWIPILGEETRAYQFYFYVPSGEDKADYLNLMKHLLRAE